MNVSLPFGAAHADADTVLYVYFKVPVAEHDQVAVHVRAFQAHLLAQWPGLHAQLLQRPQTSDGQETWMEIYQHAKGLSTELQTQIEKTALAAGLPLPRHSERFISLR